MVKMKKCFDTDDNGDDNGDDDNGTDVKLKRAFKKSDCAGTQGAAAPSPSAQLSRIQSQNFHYYNHYGKKKTTITITTTTTSITTRKTTSTTTTNSLAYKYNH